MKQAAEAADKAKARRSEDIDARLDRLMKEIEVLRKEIRQTKEKPAK
jgi:hypothetical protein